ncbi:MAG: hypothetical protein AABY95_09295 [Pseudomonadota bacterium]
MNAVQLAQLSCGLFFITGMLTGVWKYHCITSSAEAKAPVYVDICHRTALMYTFACLVLAEFAKLSVWPDRVNFWAVLVPVLFFASAVATYALHGLLKDTDNQFQRPHVLGPMKIHSGLISLFMGLLAVGEIGGFLVLFAGFLKTLQL